MIFIITILLLAADFYYLKNIAGRRLVGLRWWNEVDPSTGDSKWVFESSDPATKTVNATDSRFFWLALYVQPVLWVVMAILALVRLQFLWLPLVSELPPAHLPLKPASKLRLWFLNTLFFFMIFTCVLPVLSHEGNCPLPFKSNADKWGPHCSHRAGSDGYEHSGLLEMRQV